MFVDQNTKTADDNMRLCRSSFQNIIVFKIFSYLIRKNASMCYAGVDVRV